MNAGERIAKNLTDVRERISAAAQRSGRSADEVTLVAVTKYVDSETTAMVAQAGCHDFGESRPQQLWEKADLLSGSDVNWHLVGHLQRNKIRKTVPCAELIHSVDSEALLLAINRIAEELGQPQRVLLEVNVSGDSSKHGLSALEVGPLLDTAAALANVQIQGLMTMAALSGDEAVARRNFRELRELRNALQANAPENVALSQLSMGMSRDYEIAVEEGSTIVRVGSCLFEGLS